MKDIISEIIADIKEKFNISKEKDIEKNYIFRGVNQIFKGKLDDNSDRVNSSLYRWIKEHTDEVSNFKEYQKEHIATKAKEKLFHGGGISEEEILSAMRHYGGRTNHIDFTKSIPVALFFACHGESRITENGELFILKIEDSNYNVEIIEPVVFNKLIHTEGRAKIQHSIFVNHEDGYLKVSDSPPVLKAIPIKAGEKREILKYINNLYDINAYTVFNDLMGYINNDDNYKTPLTAYNETKESKEKL